MNWLSKEDERKSWKMFCKSFWYPAYMWFICIFTMYGISYIIVTFPEENRNNDLEKTWGKFKEIITFIQSGVNFQISIIAMFGTLILTLFVNSRNENTWSSPEEYARKSSYRKYVCTITHFLGFVWFLSFLCKIFNIGKYSDVPAWVFLFLSWFVFSIETHVDKTDVSIHNKVMSSYRNLVKLETENKYLDEISDYIYKIHTRNEEIDKWYDLMLKKITPGTMKGDKLISLVGISLDIVGGFEKGRIKNFVKQFTVLTSQILLSVIIQVFLLWLIFRLVYSVELNIGSNSVSLWIVTVIYGVFILGPYLAILYSNMINWRISSKVYPQHFKNIMEYLGWIILYYLFLLMMQYMLIISLVESLTFNRHQPYHVDIIILLIILFMLIVIPILEIWFYVKGNLDKKVESIDSSIMHIFQSLYSKSTNRRLELADSSINIYKIAMSVYLRMSSYESYREYMHSLGRSVEDIDNDLKDAYKKAKRDFE